MSIFQVFQVLSVVFPPKSAFFQVFQVFWPKRGFFQVLQVFPGLWQPCDYSPSQVVSFPLVLLDGPAWTAWKGDLGGSNHAFFVLSKLENFNDQNVVNPPELF